MSSFNPSSSRKLLEGDCGYRFDLAADINQAAVVGGRGNSADAFLGTAIHCLLVGLDGPAARLLHKVEEWVSAAIADREVPRRYFEHLRNEPYILDGAVAHCYQTLALCDWLRNGEHDAESFHQFVEHEERFLAGSPAGKDKVNVSLTLPTYVDARAYEKAVQRFAATRGLAAPRSLGSIRNEGQMSYVLCRQRLNKDYTEVDLASALARWLNKQVDRWLSEGHFVRAAEWMKIVYWNEQKRDLSAKDALLRCYAHLPGVGPVS
jgi:hypothetical protein